VRFDKEGEDNGLNLLFWRIAKDKNGDWVKSALANPLARKQYLGRYRNLMLILDN
jgi:hypothetical protein